MVLVETSIDVNDISWIFYDCLCSLILLLGPFQCFEPFLFSWGTLPLLWYKKLWECTVFSPIEAPGAKEVVRGASIFRPEEPDFKINMVKKDSKNSRVFQSQSKHFEHQKNPLRVCESTIHCHYSTACIENTVNYVQFLHQGVQFSCNPRLYLSKNKGGASIGRGLLLEKIRYMIYLSIEETKCSLKL